MTRRERRWGAVAAVAIAAAPLALLLLVRLAALSGPAHDGAATARIGAEPSGGARPIRPAEPPAEPPPEPPPPADVSGPGELVSAPAAPPPAAPAAPPAPAPPAAAPAGAPPDAASAAALARVIRTASTRPAGKDAKSRAADASPPGPPPGTAVFGLVIDPSGNPVAGALVIVITFGDQPAAKPALTDASGAYALPHDGISNGQPHRIRAEFPAFRPRETGLPPRGPDDPPTRCDLALDDGPAKPRRVLFPGGMPAPGATVTVAARAGMVVSDRDGAFLLPVLPPGDFLVVARLAPRLAAIGIVHVDADGYPPLDGPLELTLGEEGAIEASGLEPVSPGVGTPTVLLWAGGIPPRIGAGADGPAAPPPFGASPFATATPDARGVFRFDAVPPGMYVVAAVRPLIGWLSPDPIAVDLAPGTTKEVYLGRSGTAALVVVARRDGGPPARAVFSAWGDQGESSIFMATDGSGVARMEGLEADRYFVFCNDQQGGLGRDFVTLVPGEVHTLELTILKAGRLTGVLVDADGKPATGAKVTADTVEGGIQREALVDAEGRFALEMLYPGKQLIRASLDGRTTSQVIDVGVGEDKGPLGFALGP
jgi:hypothetical protein